MPARTMLRMATIEGATALGLDGDIGSIEKGKKADLQVLDRRRAHCFPEGDPAGTIVHSMGRDNVRHVLTDGRVVVRDRRLATADITEVIREAEDASVRLLKNAKMTVGRPVPRT